ncbi:MAG: hypothetical protein AB8D52_03070 [Gammaproteobacteria bacterium]
MGAAICLDSAFDPISAQLANDPFGEPASKIVGLAYSLIYFGVAVIGWLIVSQGRRH